MYGPIRSTTEERSGSCLICARWRLESGGMTNVPDLHSGESKIVSEGLRTSE